MLSTALRRRLSTPTTIWSSSVFVLVCVSLYLVTKSSLPSRFLKHSNDSGFEHGRFNSTLGFQQIFVVNLPERTDRRDGMTLAAALGDVDLEFIDAVRGEQVLDKALPPLPKGKHRMADASVGSWRGHMNAIREVVRRNLTSALILEDDADWDMRIKEQLFEYAYTSRALLQRLSSDHSAYTDSTYPTPQDAASSGPIMDFNQLPSTIKPTTSPYGDNWDVLWLGHCGMSFPTASSSAAANVPKGRVVRLNDPTVPERQYLHTVFNTDDLKDEYPSHTRLTHHVSDAACSLGYAVSQVGARRLLYWLGLMEMTTVFDLELRHFCEGSDGKPHHNCLTVQPGLFQHHRPAGNKTFESDISSHGTEYREKPVTEMIRWSLRMNVETLLDGKTNFLDQFPDTE